MSKANRPFRLTESESVFGPLSPALLVTNSASENGHLALANASVLRPLGKVLLLLLSVACKNREREEEI